MKKKIIGYSITCLVALIIFIIFVILIKNSGGAPLEIDANIRDFFYNIRGERDGFLYHLFRILTELGGFTFILISTLLVIIFTKLDNRAISYVLGAIIVFIFYYVLKDIFQRERPYIDFRWGKERDSSFPSGHSAAIAFLTLFVFYMVNDMKLKKAIKIAIYVVLALLGIIVPISRMLLGMHYFTDVIAGFMQGLIIASLVVLFNMFMKHYGIFEKPIFVAIYEYFKNRKKENIDFLEDKEATNKIDDNESINKNEDIE